MASVVLLLLLAVDSVATSDVSDQADESISPEEILEQHGFSANTADLLRLLEHDNPLVRQMAVTIIGERGIETAVSDIRSLLADPNGYVRIAAAEALLKLNDAAGLEVLKAELMASDPFVQLNAAVALCRRQQESGHGVIAELLKNSNPIVRVMAVVALRDCTTFPNRVENLSEMTKDSAEDVRVESLELLGELALQRTIPIFIRALEDPSDVVRYAANRILIELTNENMGYEHWAPAKDRAKAIERWKTWWEKQGTAQTQKWRFSYRGRN